MRSEEQKKIICDHFDAMNCKKIKESHKRHLETSMREVSGISKLATDNPNYKFEHYDNAQSIIKKVDRRIEQTFDHGPYRNKNSFIISLFFYGTLFFETENDAAYAADYLKYLQIFSGIYEKGKICKGLFSFLGIGKTYYRVDFRLSLDISETKEDIWLDGKVYYFNFDSYMNFPIYNSKKYYLEDTREYETRTKGGH